jgi:hypothetical protein
MLAIGRNRSPIHGCDFPLDEQRPQVRPVQVRDGAARRSFSRINRQAMTDIQTEVNTTATADRTLPPPPGQQIRPTAISPVRMQ